jgi:hypothetical protein
VKGVTVTALFVNEVTVTALFRFPRDFDLLAGTDSAWVGSLG